MDDEYANMSENEEIEENKDRNSGRCPETRQLDETDEGREEVGGGEEGRDVPVAQCIPSSSETERSDVDGWPFRKANKETNNDGSTSRVTVKIDLLPDAENYNMHHKRRGVALIFNNVYFSQMKIRKGSDKDCDDLAHTLRKLDFEVRIHKDPSLEKIYTILKETAAEDHTDADCLIVTVMSHGESTLLYSADTCYPVHILWTDFTADQCTTLAGKPKLFFIQACRGNQFDEGVVAVGAYGVDVTDSGPESYTIPTCSDIFVAYSTQDGFYSWRNPDDGSWFIQAICEEFNINGRTRDLLTLMTFVNRRVAINYQSYVPHQKNFHEKKQMPSIVSMLTRLVYFPKKSILRSSPTMLHADPEENIKSNTENKDYETKTVVH